MLDLFYTKGKIMHHFTPEEQFDTSVLEPILGEDNEVIGYFDEELHYNDPAEIADEYFSDAEAQFSAMATECSYLMDQVEAEGGAHTSEDGDPRMIRISEIATILSYFRPELLDPRFQ
jgi:hypothetical protein